MALKRTNSNDIKLWLCPKYFNLTTIPRPQETSVLIKAVVVSVRFWHTEMDSPAAAAATSALPAAGRAAADAAPASLAAPAAAAAPPSSVGNVELPDWWRVPGRESVGAESESAPTPPPTPRPTGADADVTAPSAAETSLPVAGVNSENQKGTRQICRSMIGQSFEIQLRNN